MLSLIISNQNATVPAPGVKLVNFERESDMKAGEARTVKVAISPSQMTVSMLHSHPQGMSSY